MGLLNAENVLRAQHRDIWHGVTVNICPTLGKHEHRAFSQKGKEGGSFLRNMNLNCKCLLTGVPGTSECSRGWQGSSQHEKGGRKKIKDCNRADPSRGGGGEGGTRGGGGGGRRGGGGGGAAAAAGGGGKPGVEGPSRFLA
ncbi:POU domain, class 4, transcription factor 1-like [Suncus etruscus]|uniref:POU domain, class 4, transcription factor 1-like n=1 Tax=Suncus etruscus TaxID=109475 RepID=UPI00210F78D8|nr:POU domain, class 4, transcription factor 1-like [Suncus etruscus]